MENSPGHQPRACQTTGTSPQSLVTVPFRYWTPVSGVQKDTIYGILGGGVWAPAASCQTRRFCFSAVQKSIRKSITFFIDFGSQNDPKIHPPIPKNPSPKPSRNQSPKTTTNIQTQTKPNLENRALVYTRRLFSLFYRFQKYNKKLTKNL